MSSNYVSRAGDKLADAASWFSVDFRNKAVLDIGSSTGGFTDYVLQQGASEVIAVDSGTNQLHPKLRADNRVELHEKTDIFDFWPETKVDIVLIDVSFISLKSVLEYVKKRCGKSDNVTILAMLKPQFEAKPSELNKGVVKNSAVRRKIIKDFERNIKGDYLIKGKKDNDIAGSSGNIERFYLLNPVS